jgi:ribosomal protein L11 methyltransferase
MQKTNTYTQIIFDVEFANTQLLEDFVDFCSESGALSVSIEDALADTLDEKPVYGEPGYEVDLGWNKSKVTALLDNSMSLDIFLAELLELSEIESLPPYTTENIDDQDWVSITQSQFDPIPVGNKLVIMPSWHIQESLNNNTFGDRAVISLDPGLAFGTGSHPTTNLCLQWIEQNINQGITDILDYGCGSGILAIAAHKMGAKNIVGVDIDTQAVESAKYNSSNNNCTDINFYQPNNESWLNYNPSTFNIVLANILSNPLKLMCGLLANRVNHTGGYLVLSGILARQAHEIQEVYKPYMHMEVWQELDGWVCMVGRK